MSPFVDLEVFLWFPWLHSCSSVSFTPPSISTLLPPHDPPFHTPSLSHSSPHYIVPFPTDQCREPKALIIQPVHPSCCGRVVAAVLADKPGSQQRNFIHDVTHYSMYCWLISGHVALSKTVTFFAFKLRYKTTEV